MRVVSTQRELQAFHGGVLVPTMGALHTGHFELVRQARRAGAGPVIVSVFVNPTQFNDPKDLARYPRTLDADVAGCERSGADVVFAPSVEEMYPPGEVVRVPKLPQVATTPRLEDAKRPGHFAGVCQVVYRLFEMVMPAVALFGEKDWQQLQVIRAMVSHESLRIDVRGIPTVRESDGLAMSSRNVFLTTDERPRASAIWRAMSAARREAKVGSAELIMRTLLSESGLECEYAVVRDAQTLMPVADPVASPQPACRMLIAARLGQVRLIDNESWHLGECP